MLVAPPALPCPACRLDARFILVNATTVAPHQELVQYLIYWQIMTSSSDPAMRAEAAWVQRGPGITIWEVGAGEKGRLAVWPGARFLGPSLVPATRHGKTLSGLLHSWASATCTFLRAS